MSAGAGGSLTTARVQPGFSRHHPCAISPSRIPLIRELADLLRRGYEGR